MKRIIPILLVLCCFGLFQVSCSNDNADPIDTEQTTDDTTDPTDDTDGTGDDGTLNFVAERISVTFDLCELPFCSISQLLFLDENIGFAVTGVWVYKTLDGGETWDYLLNQDITGRMFALNEQDLFINTYDGILWSVDGGDNWFNIVRPLEFLCDGAGINPGIMYIPDNDTAFVLDLCDRLEMHKTDDLGLNWELIFESPTAVEDYYFQDQDRGIIRNADGLLVTRDGGVTWNASENIPVDIDYYIDRDDFFEFPDGIAIPKPDTLSTTTTVAEFHVNSQGDIAVIFFDEAAPSAEQWQLMIYLSETSEWFFVDQLPDPVTDNENSEYVTIFLTEAKTMFLGISFTGDILKYYVE